MITLLPLKELPFISSSSSEGCFSVNDDGMIWFVVMSDREDDDTCEGGDVLEWKESAGEATLCGLKGVNVPL